MENDRPVVGGCRLHVAPIYFDSATCPETQFRCRIIDISDDRIGRMYWATAMARLTATVSVPAWLSIQELLKTSHST